jgi:ubiquinone/menaquinone biosynthesis C-methylase UbiE
MTKPIFLNIGSGTGRLDPKEHEEITIDLEPGADHQGSLLSLPVEENFAEVCYLGHCLEHVHRHEIPQALKEVYRVLKPGGVVHIRVPDLGQVCALVASDGLDTVAYTSPAGPINAHDMLYGYTQEIAKGQPAMAHKTGFTGLTLRQAVEAAGFTKVAGERHPWELRCEGTKP